MVSDFYNHQHNEARRFENALQNTEGLIWLMGWYNSKGRCLLMNVVLRARFDGKVIVPDEPISLPEGTALEVGIRILQPKEQGSGSEFESLYRMIGLAEQGPMDASVHHNV
jgi:hypothetical protein